MVKARMSAAEWEKIKKESGIVESNGEAHRIQEDEEPEPISTPTKKYPQVGQMQAAKGNGQPVGEAAEWKSHKGYYVPAHTFEGKHPTLAKAIDIGKKAVGKASEFVDEEILHHDEEKEKKQTEEEKKEENKEDKKKKQKKLTGIEKKIKSGLLEDEDEDEDEDIIKSKSKKSKVLSRSYESAYAGQGGIFGTRGYEPAYKSTLGAGSYQPAYKSTMRGEEPEPTKRTLPDVAQIAGVKGRGKKSVVEEMIPTGEPTPTPKEPEPDRFNMQNWQSLGFPNTLPQAARGALFRPAPQQPQQVVPMVRQPYQPRAQMPMPRIGAGLFTTPTIATPRAQMPRFNAPGTVGLNIPRIGIGSNLPRVATPAIKRAQTTATMPKMGGSLFTNLPQIMKPQQKVTNTNAAPAQITMFGVPMKKKNK